MRKIYLDYAAATPLADEVLKAMQPYLSDSFYNPSALYSGAREAKVALESARASVAHSIGARPAEITFTAGGTESANLAIHGVMAKFPEAELLVSAVEHDAVLEPASLYDVKHIGVDNQGRVKIASLKALLNEKTVLVSVLYANNEVGTVQPLSEIHKVLDAERINRRKKGNALPLYLHTDACQAPLYLPVHAKKLGVDLMTLNGGKIQGPKQSGILYHRSGILLEPLIRGGGQEYGLRSGTENVAACVGFAKALEIAISQRETFVKRIEELSRFFIDELQLRFNAELNGHTTHRLANNVHVTFTSCDNERVLFSLDDQGIFAASGSACSASDEAASHVLLAMGLSDEEARSSIRFTLGVGTTKDDLEHTLVCLETALKA